MSPSEYWDETVRKMRESHLEFKIARYKAKVHLNLIKKWTGDLKDKRILKTDLFKEYFKRDSFFYKMNASEKFGLDICKEITSKVNKRGNEFRLSVADVHKLPFGDEKFDLIISNSTLDHIKRKWVPKSLKEMKRILKPNGQIILTIDNRENPLYMSGLFIGQKLNILPFYQERCYSRKEIEEFFEKENVKIKDMDAIFHTIPPLSHLACFLEKHNFPLAEFISKKIVRASKKIKNKNTKFITGRLLSFKIEKVS